MYSYLADANDVFRDINVAELDKDTNQARIFLKRASLDFFYRSRNYSMQADFFHRAWDSLREFAVCSFILPDCLSLICCFLNLFF